MIAKLVVLSSKQRLLLSIAERNGYVSVQDAYVVYCSQSARLNALRLLVKLGFLRHDSSVPNRFVFVRKED